MIKQGQETKHSQGLGENKTFLPRAQASDWLGKSSSFFSLAGAAKKLSSLMFKRLSAFDTNQIKGLKTFIIWP